MAQDSTSENRRLMSLTALCRCPDPILGDFQFIFAKCDGLVNVLSHTHCLVELNGTEFDFEACVVQ
jgi:hypothetical protein